MNATTRPPAPPTNLRDAQAVADLFVGFFRRDLLGFYPQGRFEPSAPGSGACRADHTAGPNFRLVEATHHDEVELFGVRYAVGPRGGGRFTGHDRRMIRAVGAVLGLRYHHLFQLSPTPPRLELYRGGSEDHYIAAFVEPSAYAPPAGRPSRIASTIQTLRTAALSTYENRRVSTGALLTGPGDDPVHPARPTPPDALDYGVELTSLKSLHRLCDGMRTLFLVDRDGRLADVIDVRRWAAGTADDGAEAAAPCARAYSAHARATAGGAGHVCLVLSPNQEIKLFAGGSQAFAFAHGQWRVLDPAAKYALWQAEVGGERLARVLYQTALDLAELRQGGLFVVVNDQSEAVGKLIAPHDLLAEGLPCGPPAELTPGDPLAKRALHYLARGRDVPTLDASVLEALAGLDGAIVTDRAGRLLAFGAILRHDAGMLPSTVYAEGARTTAALVASRFGPVLKVSEDGVVSCFVRGARVWDL